MQSTTPFLNYLSCHFADKEQETEECKESGTEIIFLTFILSRKSTKSLNVTLQKKSKVALHKQTQ